MADRRAVTDERRVPAETCGGTTNAPLLGSDRTLPVDPPTRRSVIR